MISPCRIACAALPPGCAERLAFPAPELQNLRGCASNARHSLVKKLGSDAAESQRLSAQQCGKAAIIRFERAAPRAPAREISPNGIRYRIRYGLPKLSTAHPMRRLA